MAYTIFIKYKNAEAPVLNISFSVDGSVHLIDLISRNVQNPEYDIFTADFPVKKSSSSKSVKIDKSRYYAAHRLKFSHHQSGFFQVSGEDSKKIISGIDDVTGLPKGVSVDGFNLESSTTDGGPFLTANVWGVNHLPNKKSKSSESIFFTEKEIDYQSIENRGQKPSFAFQFYHLPKSIFKEDQLKTDWFFYNYSTHFKKPLLLRLLKDSISHGYVVGVTCLKARADFKDDFGVAMMGGVGLVDHMTGTCRSITVIFPRSKIVSEEANYLSLERN